MKAKVTRPAVDLGVVVSDHEAMLAFYRDLLGLEDLGPVAVPGFGLFQRLRCGESTIKLLLPEQGPPTARDPDGFAARSGLRYFTVWVANLDEILAAASADGRTVSVPATSLGPFRMAMLEDPEGNTVELLEANAGG